MTVRAEALPLIKSSLNLKQSILEFSCGRYQQRLEAFEQQYGMSSSEFIVRFQAGELGDEAVWFEWQVVWDAYQKAGC